MIDLFCAYGIEVPHKAGKTFRCPFRKDNTPSVTISISRDNSIVHFNDWHNKGEKPSYNISDIRASLNSGKLMWVKNNQHMMRHLILAAVETGRVTANAKRLATKLLSYYKVFDVS